MEGRAGLPRTCAAGSGCVAHTYAMCYNQALMKAYIHARLGERDRAMLEELKQATGRSESEIVRRGLRLVAQETGRQPNALELAGRSVGRFKKAPRDLSANKKHFEGFGE